MQDTNKTFIFLGYRRGSKSKFFLTENFPLKSPFGCFGLSPKPPALYLTRFGIGPPNMYHLFAGPAMENEMTILLLYVNVLRSTFLL